MPYFILAIAVASLLLIGCSFGGTLKERQERAERILNTTTEQVVGGVEGVKSAGSTLGVTLSSAATKLQETTEELQKRAEQLQQGVEKVAGAVKAGQDGIEQAKDALSVVGADGEEGLQ